MPRKARDESLRAGIVLVTTDYVLDETLTLIRLRLGLPAARRWWEQVDSSARVRWESVDVRRAEKARGWFFGWGDKDFYFTDCTSFVVMRELRLRRVLTTLAHFRQADFETAP